MADRYIDRGAGYVKIGEPHTYKVGETVFFSTGNHTVAGEGMFVGRLRADPGVMVLVIGGDFVETLASECAPTGYGRPAEGRSWRTLYQKERPGALAPA